MHAHSSKHRMEGRLSKILPLKTILFYSSTDLRVCPGARRDLTIQLVDKLAPNVRSGTPQRKRERALLTVMVVIGVDDGHLGFELVAERLEYLRHNLLATHNSTNARKGPSLKITFVWCLGPSAHG